MENPPTKHAVEVAGVGISAHIERLAGNTSAPPGFLSLGCGMWGSLDCTSLRVRGIGTGHRDS